MTLANSRWLLAAAAILRRDPTNHLYDVIISKLYYPTPPYPYLHFFELLNRKK